MYDKLHSVIMKLNCAKVLKPLTTHWAKERSVVDMPRSNMVVESAVKLMGELHNPYKNVDKVQYRNE